MRVNKRLRDYGRKEHLWKVIFSRMMAVENPQPLQRRRPNEAIAAVRANANAAVAPAINPPANPVADVVAAHAVAAVAADGRVGNESYYEGCRRLTAEIAERHARHQVDRRRIFERNERDGHQKWAIGFTALYVCAFSYYLWQSCLGFGAALLTSTARTVLRAAPVITCAVVLCVWISSVHTYLERRKRAIQQQNNGRRRRNNAPPRVDAKQVKEIGAFLVLCLFIWAAIELLYRYTGWQTPFMWIGLMYALRIVSVGVCVFLALWLGSLIFDEHSEPFDAPNSWITGSLFVLSMSMEVLETKYEFAAQTYYVSWLSLLVQYVLIHGLGVILPTLCFFRGWANACSLPANTAVSIALFTAMGVTKYYVGFTFWWLPFFAALAYAVRIFVWCAVGWNIIALFDPNFWYGGGRREDFCCYLCGWTIPLVIIEVLIWYFHFEFPYLSLTLRYAFRLIVLIPMIWVAGVFVACGVAAIFDQNARREWPVFVMLLGVGLALYSLVEFGWRKFSLHAYYVDRWTDPLFDYVLFPFWRWLWTVPILGLWWVTRLAITHFCAVIFHLMTAGVAFEMFRSAPLPSLIRQLPFQLTSSNVRTGGGGLTAEQSDYWLERFSWRLHRF